MRPSAPFAIVMVAVVAWTCSVLGQARTITVVKAGKLVDVATGTVTSNQMILVEGGTIQAVGAALPTPPGATVIDWSTSTVQPGLFDAHTHLCAEVRILADKLGVGFLDAILLDPPGSARVTVLIKVPTNCATTLVGLLLRLGLSQRQLAERVGAASRAVIYQWESGKPRPSAAFWLLVERLKRQQTIARGRDFGLDGLAAASWLSGRAPA